MGTSSSASSVPSDSSEPASPECRSKRPSKPSTPREDELLLQWQQKLGNRCAPVYKSSFYLGLPHAAVTGPNTGIKDIFALQLGSDRRARFGQNQVAVRSAMAAQFEIRHQERAVDISGGHAAAGASDRARQTLDEDRSALKGMAGPAHSGFSVTNLSESASHMSLRALVQPP